MLFAHCSKSIKCFSDFKKFVLQERQISELFKTKSNDYFFKEYKFNLIDGNNRHEIF